MRRIFIFILVLGIVGFGGVLLHTSAQTTLDVSLELIPLNPEPNTPVTIRATSYGTDLDQASISWTYNGTPIANGTGVRAITITAPSAGTTGQVAVSVSAAGYASTTTSISLRPASVDLLWEAVDAAVPPFYKGKALVADGATVRATVIPSASAISGLSYTWSRNGSTLADISGYGKRSMLFTHNILTGTERIGVDVRGGIFSGSNTLTIAPQATDLIAYKNNDGFIDYTQGFSSTIGATGTGALIHFEPYYFSVPTTIARSLTVTMTSGEQDVTPLNNPLEIGIARPDTAGSRTIRVGVATRAYSLQHRDTLFTISFN